MCNFFFFVNELLKNERIFPVMIQSILVAHLPAFTTTISAVAMRNQNY